MKSSWRGKQAGNYQSRRRCVVMASSVSQCKAVLQLVDVFDLNRCSMYTGESHALSGDMIRGIGV